MSIIRQQSCTFRYRVIEVLHVMESDWDDERVLSAVAGAGRTREFKTLKGAQAYKEHLSAESRWPVLLQVGCVQWLSEAAARAWAQDHKEEYWE